MTRAIDLFFRLVAIVLVVSGLYAILVERDSARACLCLLIGWRLQDKLGAEGE